MSHNFGSELCIYKSLAYIAEPLEVIVIFALSECVFSKCLTINKIKSSRWGVYTHRLHANTLYINKMQKTLLCRHKGCKAKLSNRPFRLGTIYVFTPKIS